MYNVIQKFIQEFYKYLLLYLEKIMKKITESTRNAKELVYLL